MNSSDQTPENVSMIKEFAEIVARQEGFDAPLVVGGHAVNLWSEYYLAKEAKVSERALINVLEETLEISTSNQAIKAAQLWDFNLLNLWPTEILKSFGEGKISRWLEHRLS